ncbi:xylulokinase [Palleronia caenipelagi]|uniref:Xylulose kinase n=1 Tax=Palleronia caenipelagi TaxID=2489174 RepID=A0A547Q8P7_9RHOB|nr:xylulokinase [Palleronia caenipelagi]TRD22769.1 xylulokinase [Palleronia caenipelagi]
MTYLGIDLGTSGLRALLIGADGAPIGSAEAHYTVATPHPGWSEQDPGHWILALDQAIETLRATHPEFADLRGIGVAGHMHGATLLDSEGAVIRPCILWNDTRSHAEAAHLDAVPRVRELSGNIVFPGFTAPKLAWVVTHEPENFARMAQVLLPAAFLNRYLTGEGVTDMSDAAGTSWLDVGAREWSAELLKVGGMSAAQMPRLVEGCAPAGVLRADLARRWGLGSDVVVAGGAGDNAAAACGIGALEEGQGFVSLGTSGVILAARDGYRPAPETAIHTFCHAVPARWYQMAVMLSATDCLNWLSRVTGAKPAELTSPLGETLAAPGALRFLPYLSGERTPHNDAAMRGGFAGIATSTDRDDMTRAVLEGVAFGLRDGFEGLRATGCAFDQVTAIGGGTGSRYWLKLIATVLNTPLALPKGGEFGAAMGAARLGQIASGGGSVEDVIRPPEIAEVIEPVADLVAAYDDSYHAFRAAYAPMRQAQLGV